MRKLIVAVAAACCALSAHAKILTYEFSGPITRIEHEGYGGVYTDVSSTSLTPIPVSIGTTFTGRFQFDTDALRVGYSGDTATYSDDGYGVDKYSTYKNSRLLLDNGKWVSAGHDEKGMHLIQVTNGTSGSPDQFMARTMFGDTGGLWLYLNDPSATVFSGKGFPLKLDLSKFSEHYGFAALQAAPNDDGVSYIYLRSNVTSLSLVTAVPEPSSYAMLLAGMAVVGAVYRRRRGKTLSSN
ncbi:MAG TPA: PEP-CTERM sorting domain-containing protein [Telluria sp.]|jgi:hypothetical protein